MDFCLLVELGQGVSEKSTRWVAAADEAVKGVVVALRMVVSSGGLRLGQSGAYSTWR